MSVNLMVADSFRSVGDPVVIRPDSDDSIETRGIFSVSTAEEAIGESRAFARNYTLTLPAADVVNVENGDLVDTQGQRWVVKRKEGDTVNVWILTLGFPYD